MKITLNRTLLNTLSSMSDEKLWHVFCGMFGETGTKLNKNNPDYRRIRKFRALLDGISDEDLACISRLMALYSNPPR